ncbi:MAG: hypothetical protein ACXAC7_11400 [Candidatus Hodarchaeales archaeon]|jgi:gas vesicle protein
MKPFKKKKKLDYKKLKPMLPQNFESELHSFMGTSQNVSQKINELGELITQILKSISSYSEVNLSNPEIVSDLAKAIRTTGALKRVGLDENMEDIQIQADIILDRLQETINESHNRLKMKVANKKNNNDYIYF